MQTSVGIVSIFLCWHLGQVISEVLATSFLLYKESFTQTLLFVLFDLPEVIALFLAELLH